MTNQKRFRGGPIAAQDDVCPACGGGGHDPTFPETLCECARSARQTHIKTQPSTIQLRASAHIALRTWLEAEFGADELHEQRIVSAMRELREQTGLAAAGEALQRLRGYATNFARPHGMDKCDVVDLDTIVSAVDNELALVSKCKPESDLK
jgi:hypothetical protein